MNETEHRQPSHHEPEQLLADMRKGRWSKLDDELRLEFTTTPELLGDLQPLPGEVGREHLRQMGASVFLLPGAWVELHPLHVQHVETESNVSRVARGLEPERFIDRIRVTRRFVQKR